MTELKDLCCVEACVLLSPNERQGAELVGLGLLELSLHNYLNIHCTAVSTTIEVSKTQLDIINKHELYKAFHIVLKEIYSTTTIAPLQEVIHTAQKYFGLGLEGFHTYAITPSLKSRNLISEEKFKRFFIFNATKLALTKEGKTLQAELITNLKNPEDLIKQHALLRPETSLNLSQENQNTVKCFHKAYAKQLKQSSASNLKEPGPF